ncbi:CBASS oligonucleotide cyclase [Actinomadura sp. NPDC049382]|uniref:CBASS oligonucleotide cyclase n=1 Tax=Actinomadura sp. NPDC049382 TaxID=3158220 RepID=UPI0034255221
MLDRDPCTPRQIGLADAQEIQILLQSLPGRLCARYLVGDNLEITQTEQDLAKARHAAIRDFVKKHWHLTDDFLTGSYRRDTKTKKLKDIDIFVVIDLDGPQGPFREQAPIQVIDALETLLRRKWPDARRDGMAVVIPYGPDDEVMSIDVVPAFARQGGGYFIPNPSAGSWLATNPKQHHELSIVKNEECGGKYVPFVKMIKGINRELGEPVAPSFLLEVMALEMSKPPFGRYQDEIVMFLATAAERIFDVWPDPAGLGGDVNAVMNATQKRLAADALTQAQAIAERAVDLADDEQERAAYEQWKKLFGARMTRP